jgi:hypothetical protein
MVYLVKNAKQIFIITVGNSQIIIELLNELFSEDISENNHPDPFSDKSTNNHPDPFSDESTNKPIFIKDKNVFALIKSSHNKGSNEDFIQSFVDKKFIPDQLGVTNRKRIIFFDDNYINCIAMNQLGINAIMIPGKISANKGFKPLEGFNNKGLNLRILNKINDDIKDKKINIKNAIIKPSYLFQVNHHTGVDGEDYKVGNYISEYPENIIPSGNNPPSDVYIITGLTDKKYEFVCANPNVNCMQKQSYTVDIEMLGAQNGHKKLLFSHILNINGQGKPYFYSIQDGQIYNIGDLITSNKSNVNGSPINIYKIDDIVRDPNGNYYYKFSCANKYGRYCNRKNKEFFTFSIFELGKYHKKIGTDLIEKEIGLLKRNTGVLPAQSLRPSNNNTGNNTARLLEHNTGELVQKTQKKNLLKRGWSGLKNLFTKLKTKKKEK